MVAQGLCVNNELAVDLRENNAGSLFALCGCTRSQLLIYCILTPCCVVAFTIDLRENNAVRV
jgi:hypothetical protein